MENDSTNRRRIKAFLRKEIEDAKDNLRLAYVLAAKKEAGDSLLKEELEFIEEQDIEKKVLSKLEAIFAKVEYVPPREEMIGDKEFFAVMRFFYLVRLAQQGFFHLIASAFPAIEPNAITFLADKLVAGSMGKVSTSTLRQADLIRRPARKIARDLYNQTDEPVADGFKTTFKDIMQVADRLGVQGLYEQHTKNQQSECGQTSETPQAAASASESATATSTATVDIPPIWVVMPYSSMIDHSTFPVPHINPNLPIPGFLISPNTNIQRTFESDKRSKRKKSKKSSRKADKVKEEGGEQPQTTIAMEENVVEDADNHEIGTSQHIIMHQQQEPDNHETGTSEPAIVNQGPDNPVSNDVNKKDINDTTQDMMNGHSASEEEEEDNEDDRFADADFSDDDDDSDVEEKQQQAPAIEETPVAPSQWQNYAASCNVSVKSTTSSPRSRC